MRFVKKRKVAYDAAARYQVRTPSLSSPLSSSLTPPPSCSSFQTIRKALEDFWRAYLLDHDADDSNVDDVVISFADALDKG